MKGMTLVEVLVVLLIIGVMATMSVAMFSRFGANLKLDTAAMEIATILHTARGYAISRGDVYSVDFSQSERAFWISYNTDLIDKKYKLPENITISGIANIDFSSSGSAGNGGTITVADVKGSNRSVIVVGSTGRIRIE